MVVLSASPAFPASSAFPALEGIGNIYRTGIQYTKRQYFPTSWAIGSILYILLYTLGVYYVTEYLLKGQLTRWVYLGTMAMVLSFIYRGVLPSW